MCRAGGRRCEGSTSGSRATQNLRQQRSRARRALRAARTAGDPDGIARAQQRLDVANENLKRHKENSVPSHDRKQPHDSDDARRHGDVTRHSEQPERPHVTNIVYGEVNGIQADVVSGVTIVNGRIVHAGQTGDVTANSPHSDLPPSVAEQIERARAHAHQARQQARQHREQAREQAKQARGRTSGFTNTNINHGNVGQVMDVNHGNVTMHFSRAHTDIPPGQPGDVTSASGDERSHPTGEPAGGAGEPTVQTGPRDTTSSRTTVNIAEPGTHVAVQAGVVNGEIWINGKRIR
ncbi:hypothetical protein Lesp02_85240 [Lentzea sp. NBRC 105346]|uniref:hypothetical protein n=1 Tax=Lentzea sp. NBRC 105346 TaxID=3032205 RepID=UPI0024A27426|nr:hypothetical protein [Lentzea sp. NBRC 105346]GLZ36337.1 hypothetical protein Lesp02_85240 [Lentzea sp. NBRC 105346]